MLNRKKILKLKRNIQDINNIKRSKNVPNNREVLIYNFTHLNGMGVHSGKRVCKGLGFDVNTKIFKLTKNDWKKANSIMNTKYRLLLDSELWKVKNNSIQKLKNIRCYRGVRRMYGLPIRSSRRTRTNAKTRRD